MISNPRSNCPINRGVELLGDPWSLVIIRDIMFCDHRTFRELLTRSQERITAPTLSKRLTDLVAAGLLSKEAAPRGKQGRYSLTDQGIGLAPLLFELAAAGSMLDPTTQSTVPQYAGLYGHPDQIAAFQQDLRDRHLSPASTAAG
ncbi:winged helix-turn-helix transcriptional regulator [Parenemella sanctibonifatiensis]|uniref:HxlR family transcriptional regulator n=1 Tax=Parenemella sanctibonifatiensis TaxID=2016505 RepID=A0A255E1R2_9ACTN|nr:helix-turn-helix domain-containing protein [Parenemella sanctibonifatiensis]OYN85436.1 HxlR family transcriptional regulator [Parenemella sanctibonifatiensis]OYN90847.1 HxlR family transcriptional regulator [Parenemella sanctibonifatiensis]